MAIIKAVLDYGIVRGHVAYALVQTREDGRQILNLWDYTGQGLYRVVHMPTGETVPFVHNGSGWVKE